MATSRLLSSGGRIIDLYGRVEHLSGVLGVALAYCLSAYRPARGGKRTCIQSARRERHRVLATHYTKMVGKTFIAQSQFYITRLPSFLSRDCMDQLAKSTRNFCAGEASKRAKYISGVLGLPEILAVYAG